MSWALDDVVFVGHSVSAMIGVLAAAEEPDAFDKLVFVGPSPRYIDDEGYRGGFTREDIEGLLESIDSNYLGWSSAMAPVIMANADRPELSEELANSFCRADPGDRPALRAGHLSLGQPRRPRGGPDAQPRAPVLEDAIAPETVGEYVSRELPQSQPRPARGDRPLSQPERPERDPDRDEGVSCGVMTSEASLEETAEDLFENAPCGYLSMRLDGTLVRVNHTFESLTGLSREELIGRRHFQDLLSAGGRIYYETHYAPLLQMQGWVREIAVEIVRADGSRLPALINSVLCRDTDGQPQAVRTVVFEATDRRRYEQELLIARRREQKIAQQLQRSMLSGDLPEAPGLKLEFVYRPAVSGLEIGGDWYDAFWLDDGETIGLVVGDVVGRGIDAAATMGQLRSAVRALASNDLPPGPLLDALDAYARRHGVGRMSTLVYARLGIATGRLRYACAGHPPPLLTAPGEKPRFAWGGRSLPLDAAHSPSGARPDAELLVPPGGALVMYTDGLVERPSRPLTEGMAALRDLVAQHGPAAGTAVRALHEAERADDVCVLTASLDGA